MTYRDPAPERPACPICDSTEQVQAHDNPHQGRWLALCHMVLFDDTSAEWAKPEHRKGDISGLETARAALKEAAER